MTVLGPPLDRISKVARPYPAYLLPQGGTGLALFAAAFQGHNDSIHMARQDMTVTCVDIDQERLLEMSLRYPAGWEFVCRDAWEYAEDAVSRGRTWDVVSVDTFTGSATERSLTTLPLWCALARSVVTATIVIGQDYIVPEGWRAHTFPRSDRVSWLVLARA